MVSDWLVGVGRAVGMLGRAFGWGLGVSGGGIRCLIN
jgi:hypothetical protein